MLNHHRLVPTGHGEDFTGSVVMTAIDVDAVPTLTFLLDEGYGKVDYHNDAEQPRVLVLRTASGDSCPHCAARCSSPDELQKLLGFCRRWSEGGVPRVRVAEETDALVELLNCINSVDRTALFVAATSTSESLDDRNTKTSLLLDAGGKLFGTTPFLVANSSSTMVLSEEGQQCLSLWLSECAEERKDEITIFCIEYFAIVGSAHLEFEWHCSYEVVNILASSVHTADVMSLLLSLPFDDS
ncbi:Amino Acid/Auxin Permease (AAAP) Family [Phytophthora cinnamomi]|uniref:Amino Acid/Auxin Permease (AAAP) Family n=1 Tax=Phytophthora cinnamomi TaxID=4785 RepID=UPI00355A9940|nr:Amino Acid/Auxin Permease (AAAP) Family [Phytophthora cinnamomi]